MATAAYLPNNVRYDQKRSSVCSSPWIEKVEEALGPVSILVNNAGISRGSARHRTIDGILDHTLEDWDRVIETNHRLISPALGSIG